MIYLSLTILILGLLQIWRGRPLISINTGTQWNTVNDNRELERKITELTDELSQLKIHTKLEKAMK